MAFIYNKDVIRDLLPECLRGNEAIMWYTTELLDLEQTLLRSTNLEH